MSRDRRKSTTTRIRRDFGARLPDGRTPGGRTPGGRTPKSSRPPGSLQVPPEEFDALVEKAMAQLPGEFAERIHNVVVVVEEEPDPEVLAEMGFDGTDDELLGLYQGIGLTERQESQDLPRLPDHISLYRGPLLRICQSRRELIREVRDTLVHELGHYFGLSDDDMPY